MTKDPFTYKALAFFPADHAEAVNGKVHIVGGAWNRLFFPTFPQVLAHLALVAVVEVPFSEYLAEHTVTITMVDATEAPQKLKVEGKFRVGASADMNYGDSTVMPLAIPVNNLLVEHTGDFFFVLAIDGEEVTRFGFKAMQVPMTLPFAPQAQPESEAS